MRTVSVRNILHTGAMRSDPTGRALELLSLLQTHRWWSGAELASRLAVTERTLRRDVDRLRDMGYPVDAATGPHGGYRLAVGAHMPPLQLDDEEAVAVALGLRHTASGSIGGMEETSLRALAKIESLLPHRLRRRVSAVHSNVTSMPPGDHDDIVDSETLSMLAAACRDHEEVRFDYRRHDGAHGPRHVQPHQLVTAGRRWYLVGWDCTREDWRTFRLDRIVQVSAVARRFRPREIPGGDAASHLRDSLAAMPRDHVARLSVDAPFLALEGSFAWAECTLVEDGPTSCTIDLRSEDQGRLVLTIARLALIAPMNVLGPAQAREDIERLTRHLGAISLDASAEHA